MSRHHSVTVEFGPYGPTAELTCDAPANAGCRARFDECGCPEWWGQGDDDGIPYHTTDDGDRHQGRYDPEWCNEVEWFDATDGLDNTRGKITFAVESEWDDEHYTWHVDLSRPEAEIRRELLPPGACTECRHRWNEHDVDGSCDHYPCQCPGYRRTE